MAIPLRSDNVEPAFLPFFGMKRAPFLNLSAPTEVFNSNQCSLLDSHLAAATRRADSLVVILGVDRIGKTTLLNRFIAGLDDGLCYATFDETCVEGVQLHRSFLDQIGLGEIIGTLSELRHITSEYLVHQAKNGQHAVLFVDNAHLARPTVLEQLRWIAGIKLDGVRVCSMVFVGNLSFRRILQSPAMRSLDFRHQTTFHVRALCEGETDDYIRHRLKLAGVADAAVFPDDARALVHRHTGGNPFMINMLCNEVLAASYTQGTRVIGEQHVRSAARALGMPPHAVPIRAHGRRKNDHEAMPSVPRDGATEPATVRPPALAQPAGRSPQPPSPEEVANRNLRVRISELSNQLERRAEEERQRALADARRHDQEMNELRTQFTAQVDDLTRSLAEHKAALAEREETIARLAADLRNLDPATAQGASGSGNSRSARRQLRRLVRRPRAMRGTGRTEGSQGPERPAGEAGRNVAPPHADPHAGTTGTDETWTLLPHMMMAVPVGQQPAAAAGGRAEFIELLLDGKPWKVVDLACKPSRIMIGRADDCDLRLDSRYVSRHHAILVLHDGGIVIEDLRSSNGVFVNSAKVVRSELRPGDTVAIGNFWLRVRYE
ncbi:MAG TPA: FHA domain-containing protein [Steroidobacteraceae bacterium]